MEVERTAIAGVLILRPTIHRDERGFFLESWNQRVFDEIVPDVRFVQDNHSRSRRNVLRGIHFQQPSPQGKLVRVSAGSIWDVAVDLRASSPTFKSWVGVDLDAEDHDQFWIPPGCGHGFVVTSDFADVQYKATSFYDPSADRAIRFDDQDLGIEWPAVELVVSSKDATAPFLRDVAVYD